MGKLILLADDSATVQQLVRLAFEDEGIEVLPASTVSDARDSFSLRTPDLILVDPLIDGDARSFLRGIRTNLATSRIPVVLLSAAASPMERGAGADAILRKPFESMTLLVSTVKELLERGSLVADRPSLEIVSGTSLHDAERDDLILELQDSLAPPQPTSDARSSTLLSSISSDDMEAIAERVISILLTRLREEACNGSVPETMDAVLEMMERISHRIESKNSGDIDEVKENPDY